MPRRLGADGSYRIELREGGGGRKRMSASAIETRFVGVERSDKGPPAGYRREVRAVPAGTWSPEAVLRALHDWARENGRAPRAEDWSASLRVSSRSATSNRRVTAVRRSPSPATVRRYFGSWSAALEEAGLRTERLAPWELSLRERVATALQLSARGLTATEIAQSLEVSAATVRKYLQAGVCPDCRGPRVSPTAARCHDCDARSRQFIWTAEQVLHAGRQASEDRAAIVAALRTLALAHNRRPRWSDLHARRHGLPSYGKTVSLFGSFSAALEAAGFQPRGYIWTRSEVISALQHWTQLHGRPPTCTDWRCTIDNHPGSRAVGELFGSWSAALTAAQLQRNWTRGQMTTALRTWAAEHGRPPTSRDWQSPDRSGSRPTTERIRREFGTWSAALAAAKLQTPDVRRRKRPAASRRRRRRSQYPTATRRTKERMAKTATG